MVLAVAAISLAQPGARPQPTRIDFGQPESTRKALPKWMKHDKEGKQAVIDQGDLDPRLKGYFTPEGVKVEIVAAAPVVANPQALAFTDEGSALVLERLPGTLQDATETISYKDGSKRTVTTPKKNARDVVKLLRDTKNAGVYDESKVILEDDLPGALLVHDGWLYTAGRGTVRRWKRAELLDRPADQPQPKAEVIAQGFGGAGPTGLTIGNDGLLYITADDDDHFAEGVADGSRITVLRTGAIFRCKPDGARLQLYAAGFRNLRGNLAFDVNFHAFHVDGAGEENGRFAGCRLLHVLEDADYGWRSLAGSKPARPDLVRAADHGELPGLMPPMAKTGRGAPNGLFIYNESRFPNYYRNVLYYPDPLRQSIRAYRVLPVGSTYDVGAEFDLLRSADPRFRPMQMTAGPDGAMYVVDSRTDPAQPADAREGRIYRITWTGNADFPAIARREMTSWAALTKAAPEEQFKALASADASDRGRAQLALAKKGAEVRADLLDVAADSKATLAARLAAMGAAQAMWNDEVRDEFLALLYAGDPAIRRLAAEGLAQNCKPGDTEADQTLLQVMGDQDLGARRAVILAAGRIGGVNAADSLANTFRSFKEDDLFLADGILRGLERLGKPGIARLVAQAQSGVERDFNHVVEAFRALRFRAAAEAIPDLLNYPHLSIPQRVNLIKSYSNYLLDPPVALAPLLRYLEANKSEPPQVKLAALEVLATPGQAHTEKAEELAAPLLDQTEAAFRMAVIRAIAAGKLAKTVHKLTGVLTEKDRPVEEQQAVLVVLATFKDKWPVPLLKEMVADGTKSGAVRAEAVRTLAELDPAAARAAAQALASDKDAEVQKAARRVLEQ